VLYHHGFAQRRELLTGANRAWLAELQLPDSARQQVAVAPQMIEGLDAQAAPITAQLRAYAKRQNGCRALIQPPTTSTTPTRTPHLTSVPCTDKEQRAPSGVERTEVLPLRARGVTSSKPVDWRKGMRVESAEETGGLASSATSESRLVASMSTTRGNNR
jgi:hypothetical protein